mmetsp:Transcript_26437/g.72992  ORF Transcript_26437/g.72992 Transcript_26437/m.72992 type:complete len:456 (-) Transcript_26437:571-1938(-)|eukprot:CAMPEP_0168835162 /NCGR_PEP_ID=MMETSP0727-20121128/3951_1 /TAXON_ID=265536 /ORGANISM="Amphiprora sp., Strain CCMP467" /LENGTH=455 /DNA_ID=CAMNT_0008888509 /DNA_START=1707 /DNA_END=3074 /DNA_ORIENTATION=+
MPNRRSGRLAATSSDNAAAEEADDKSHDNHGSEDDEPAPQGRRAKSKRKAASGVLASLITQKKIPKKENDNNDDDPDGLDELQDSDNDDDASPKIRKRQRKNEDGKAKDSLTGAIRRRARPESDPKNSQKTTSSLLGNMAQPPPTAAPSANLSSSTSGGGHHHPHNNSSNNNPRRGNEGNNRKDRQWASRENRNQNSNAGKQLMNMEMLNPAQVMVSPPRRPGSQAPPPPTMAEKRILAQLHQLCDFYQPKIVPEPNENNTTGGTNHGHNNDQHQAVDLMGSFLKLTGVSTQITMPGSMVDDEYDFFDTNEAGEIIVNQSRKPVFPEEFSPGMKDHPLSWWGVLDFRAGQGRFSATTPQPESATGARPNNNTSSHGAPPTPNSPYMNQRQQPPHQEARPYHRQHSSNSRGAGGGQQTGQSPRGAPQMPYHHQPHDRPPPHFDTRRGGAGPVQGRR